MQPVMLWPTAAGVFGGVQWLSAQMLFEETDIAPAAIDGNGIRYQTPGVGGDDIVHPHGNGEDHDVGRETGSRSVAADTTGTKVAAQRFRGGIERLHNSTSELSIPRASHPRSIAPPILPHPTRRCLIRA